MHVGCIKKAKKKISRWQDAKRGGKDNKPEHKDALETSSVCDLSAGAKTCVNLPFYTDCG